MIFAANHQEIRPGVQKLPSFGSATSDGFKTPPELAFVTFGLLLAPGLDRVAGDLQYVGIGFRDELVVSCVFWLWLRGGPA